MAQELAAAAAAAAAKVEPLLQLLEMVVDQHIVFLHLIMEQTQI